MSKTIIDTSAWVDFFRNQSGETGDTVTALIDQDRAVLTGPILAELLQGLKSRRESENLEELFSVIPYAEVDREDWEKAGNLLRKLRRRGITVPLSDAIIAVVARKHGYAVLTLDRHFDHLEVPLHPQKNQ